MLVKMRKTLITLAFIFRNVENMETNDMKAGDNINPWADVQSIYDFNFFCCPECDCKSRTKQDFVNHASKSHARAIDALKNISDGSLGDVNIPQNDDIKLEDDISIKDEMEEVAPLTPEIHLSHDEDEPLMKKVKKRKEGFSCNLCDFSGM